MTDSITTSNEAQRETEAEISATPAASNASATARFEQTPGNITRRTALAGAGLLATSSLSGCLGLLGAEPVAAEQPTTTPGTATPTPSGRSSAGGSDDNHDHDHEDRDGTPTPEAEQTPTPDAPTSLVGPGVLPADVEPERGRGGSDHWQRPDYRAYLGPLTSANHGLQDVTITNVPNEERENSPMLAYLDADYLDEPVIESDGTFTINGAFHYAHECGYYGLNYLEVTGGEALIVLAYTIDETTCTSEYSGRLGGKYGPITLTGKFDSSLGIDHLIVCFLSGVHDYDVEKSGGATGGPWSSVANWHFHV